MNETSEISKDKKCHEDPGVPSSEWLALISAIFLLFYNISWRTAVWLGAINNHLFIHLPIYLSIIGPHKSQYGGRAEVSSENDSQWSNDGQRNGLLRCFRFFSSGRHTVEPNKPVEARGRTFYYSCKWNHSFNNDLLYLRIKSDLGPKRRPLIKIWWLDKSLIITDKQLLKDRLHRFANFTIVGGCAVVFWWIAPLIDLQCMRVWY